MNTIKEIKYSFKKQPLWTLWSLALAPLFFIPVAFASVMLVIINFSVKDGVEFWNKSLDL